MYINNNKRKLDSRDLDTVQNAEYFTCIYYLSQGRSLRSEFNTYKEAYLHATGMLDCICPFHTDPENYDKRKFMFYAVKGTSQTFIGGLK